MDTIFTFKATKAEGNAKDVQYQVDIGHDILDGLTEAEIRKHATHDRVVYVQNYKGSLLRMSNSIESAEKCLKDMGYDIATVELYVPSTTAKTLTPEDVTKAIAKGTMTREQIEAILKTLPA